MNKKNCLAILCLIALLGLLAACSKKEQSASESEEKGATSNAPAATPIDPNTVATVSGTVKFDGTAPKTAKIDMSQDPACKGTNEAETVVADGGRLANVFVYVKDGLKGSFPAPADKVTIDQQGCKYHPHVLGV